MTFYQEHIVEEAGFGSQTIRIVVSDNASDLYLQNGACNYNCDCISIETTKQSLSLSDNKFGVDELKFTINEAATQNNDGNKYVNAFLLEASDRTKSRFIAVFFNPVYTSTAALILTAQFRGKVSDKISGQDLDWKNAIYSGTINPLREWKFTALSIDYALLEKCSLIEKIPKEDGNKINGVYDRITTAEMDAIFKPRLAYQGISGTTGADWFYNHFYRLGSLCDALQLMFYKAGMEYAVDVYTGILNELYPGQNFTVSIATSILTIKTQPTGYRLGDYQGYVPQLRIGLGDPASVSYAANKKIQLKIAQDTGIANDSDSPIYINERMFDASLNVLDVEPLKSRIGTENNLNFKQYGNLAELLFGIARSLGCFVKFSLTGTNNINIQFVSRENNIESELTELIDVSDAALDLSGNSSEGKATTYFTTANSQAAEGQDFITNKEIPTYWGQNDTDFKYLFLSPSEYVSEKLVKENVHRDELKEKKDIEVKRLLFSTSQTLEYQRYYAKTIYPIYLLYPDLRPGHDYMLCYQPMNIVHSSVKNPTAGTISQSLPERLSTGLYIRVTKTDMEYDPDNAPFYDLSTSDNLFCPANGIHIKYDGVEESFGYTAERPKGLTDYINYLMAIDEQYYTQEYSLTVPYWSGFKKGATIKWNQIQLGSKIKLTWNVINYAGGVFTETAVTKTFIVNEIERDYQKVETKIKLHYEGRFAYTQSIAAPAIKDYIQDEPQNNTTTEVIKEFIAASAIVAGDAMMVDEVVGVVGALSSIPLQTYYGKTIGIAMNDALVNETVFVQISGTVFCNAYNFTGHIGKYVYCRKKTHTTGMQDSTNISWDLLNVASLTENSIIVLGKIDGTNSFVLGITEIPFENYPSQT